MAYCLRAHGLRPSPPVYTDGQGHAASSTWRKKIPSTFFIEFTLACSASAAIRIQPVSGSKGITLEPSVIEQIGRSRTLGRTVLHYPVQERGESIDVYFGELLSFVHVKVCLVQPITESDSLELEDLWKSELDNLVLCCRLERKKDRLLALRDRRETYCQRIMKTEVGIHVPVAFVVGKCCLHSGGRSPNFETQSRMRSSLFGMKLSKGGYPTINSNIFTIC